MRLPLLLGKSEEMPCLEHSTQQDDSNFMYLNRTWIFYLSGTNRSESSKLGSSSGLFLSPGEMLLSEMIIPKERKNFTFFEVSKSEM